MRFPLWRRQLRDEELEEEIQAHLEMAKRDRMERGQTAEEAQESARREFGNVGLVKEVTREMWGVRSIETLFFHTLGVQSVLGRVFTTTDDQQGCGAAGLVISYTFWQREFGADANVIGRKLTLAERQFEIIGVTPPCFFGMEVGRSFDLAAPLCAVPLVQGHDRAL
ncbi:MAG TPA: permease prefix domain 1-containing protein, partial [Blastocatellia bacterium]|nr:permease prefix domain 1-containing protein [Blastocatellia bacterium]